MKLSPETLETLQAAGLEASSTSLLVEGAMFWRPKYMACHSPCIGLYKPVH